MNKTLEISAMQYDFHILTNTNHLACPAQRGSAVCGAVWHSSQGEIIVCSELPYVMTASCGFKKLRH